MLYHAIRLGCDKYHPIYGWDYDCALKAYREALKKRHKSADPDSPSFEEAAILLSFANGWSSRMQCNVEDVQPGFPILGVFRLKGQSKRDGSIIVRSCKASLSPVYPIRDAIPAVNHASCPSLSSSGPPPMG